jgi:protein FAM32A
MPSDDYSSFGKGALKLKGGGGKVKKHKKKKDKGSDLEKALSTGEEPSGSKRRDSENAGDKQIERRTGSRSRSPVEQHDDEEAPVRPKTEAERRFEEAKKRKVRSLRLPHTASLDSPQFRALNLVLLISCAHCSFWRCPSPLLAGLSCSRPIRSGWRSSTLISPS